MLLLDFQQTLMDHVIPLLGVFLNSTIGIDCCMPPNWVRTDLFQLSFELGQGVVIKAPEDILCSEACIAFQHYFTDRRQSERDSWSWKRKVNLRSDHQKMNLSFVFLIQCRVKDDHFKGPREIGQLRKWTAAVSERRAKPTCPWPQRDGQIGAEGLPTCSALLISFLGFHGSSVCQGSAGCIGESVLACPSIPPSETAAHGCRN